MRVLFEAFTLDLHLRGGVKASVGFAAHHLRGR